MAITSKLPRGIDAFGALPQSDFIQGFNLNVANTAENIPIPQDANNVQAQYVLFSATADFAAKFGVDNTVAAAMPSDIVNGSGSMLNPTFRKILPTQLFLSCVSATAGCLVSLEFYLAPPIGGV